MQGEGWGEDEGEDEGEGMEDVSYSSYRRIFSMTPLFYDSDFH